VTLPPTYIYILCVHQGTECLLIFHILLSDIVPMSVTSWGTPPPPVVITLIHRVKVNPTVYKFRVIASVLHYCSLRHETASESPSLQCSLSLRGILGYLPTSVSVIKFVFHVSHFDTYKLQCNDYIIIWCKFIESVRASIPSPLRLIIS